jgi:hypothetical protein
MLVPLIFFIIIVIANSIVYCKFILGDGKAKKFKKKTMLVGTIAQ